MKTKYCIVTPVKNEEKFLRSTIACVAAQEILPQRWIIINDNSSDSTPDIIKEAEKQYPWIEGVHNYEERQKSVRRMGGQAVVHLGLERINIDDYDFIARMDSDVNFAPDFFKNLLAEFDRNKRLGIASGVCYVTKGEKLIEEKHPRWHTRGPLKMYRRECFRDIGGLIREEGWDTVDGLKANMLGWATHSFPEHQVIHLRKTQTASGLLKGRMNLGRTAYFTGYHPLFMLARSIGRFRRRPLIIGGIYMFAGYLEGFIKRLPRIEDKQLIHYIQTQQLNKLLGKETMWK